MWSYNWLQYSYKKRIKKIFRNYFPEYIRWKKLKVHQSVSNTNMNTSIHICISIRCIPLCFFFVLIDFLYTLVTSTLKACFPQWRKSIVPVYRRLRVNMLWSRMLIDSYSCCLPDPGLPGPTEQKQVTSWIWGEEVQTILDNILTLKIFNFFLSESETVLAQDFLGPGVNLDYKSDTWGREKKNLYKTLTHDTASFFIRRIQSFRKDIRPLKMVPTVFLFHSPLPQPFLRLALHGSFPLPCWDRVSLELAQVLWLLSQALLGHLFSCPVVSTWTLFPCGHWPPLAFTVFQPLLP